jgi:NAD+ kinase
MKNVGVVAKIHYTDTKPVLEKLIPWLEKQEKSVFMDGDTASVLNDEVKPQKVYKKSKIPGLVDAIIVLGGDGTLLSVARLMEGRNIPIIGVNLGGLGFLTEVTLDEIYTTLEKLFKSEFVPEPRLLLKANVYRQGERVAQSFCLNDTVVSKGTQARMIKQEIFINGQFVTSLRGDGLILATPTGSTAYSLSAGGPILYPSVEAMILTPICPHTLTNRPVVIPATAKIEVILKSKDEGTMVTFDGQVGFTLRHEDVVEIEASEHKIILARTPDRNYYEILRTKLKWGEE